jgi:hypothetical protein
VNAAGEPSYEAQLTRLGEVKGRHLDELLGLPNVVGVGVGLRQLAEADVIPSQLEGVPVDVVEVGKLDAGV